MTNNTKNGISLQELAPFFSSLIHNWNVTFKRFIRRKESSLEWWGQRVVSGLILPLILVLIIITLSGLSQGEHTLLSFLSALFQSPKFLLLITTLAVGWHAEHGMCEVIKDYVHTEELRVASYFMIRLFIIECIKFVYFAYIII